MAQAGRSVLITGGASGIGAAVARAFVAEGARVTVLDRRPSANPDVVSVEGDVRSLADNERAVSIAAGEPGLDVLVANAGVHDGGLKLFDGDAAELEARFRRLVEVNLLGYLLAARAAAPALVEAGGAVVLTLSDASFDVHGNNAGVGYATVKHGAVGLLKALARDLAPRVRVNGIAPGGVPTGLSVADSQGERPVTVDPEQLTRRVAAAPCSGAGRTWNRWLPPTSGSPVRRPPR
ncbi:SDR family NAD(P)-dependent oxidoreductase [Blastococcus sp. PRF04-17]|uniref:SDR family NAD(P)-dependent oxidoreductase n=1 Tax=Blastococcus sp. PRF04-17 TaxID=2933797 RepID=UPI001FF2CE6F|nr:SDR family NAD(P)-dependent oxidoreductase [Blastococcus sp. PRF04-17]UOY02247.1 SDR family NAD(P)-dependent oxidoreductase [Blastococcus sp. PRF04-17]